MENDISLYAYLRLQISLDQKFMREFSFEFSRYFTQQFRYRQVNICPESIGRDFLSVAVRVHESAWPQARATFKFVFSAKWTTTVDES